MSHLFLTFFFSLALSFHGFALAQGPFSVTAHFAEPATGLTITFHVPADHYLYADTVAADFPAGLRAEAVETPKVKTKFDAFLEEETKVYDHDARFVYRLDPTDAVLSVTVRYQGCNATTCFPPVAETLEVEPGQTVTSLGGAPSPAVSSIGVGAPMQLDLSSLGATPPTSSPAPAGSVVDREPLPTTVSPAEPDGGSGPLDGFVCVAQAEGYQKPRALLRFLDQADKESAERRLTLAERFGAQSSWAMIVVILVGGLLLNLTPCVLPMIPINLAIIGAGAQAGSRLRGFVLGGTYGAGIALTYGLLGLIVVLTGSRFGTLNSSPAFNFAIAVVFVILALAMFDVLTIDLSRFRRGGAPDPSRRGRFVVAFFMGCVAALLAGACVAPVVIAVVILAGNLVAAGSVYGLLLPFLLGAGMALPWPFAGAGLALLPKPGRWMTWVKSGFGIFVLAFALYYAHLGYTLQRDRRHTDTAEAAALTTSVEEGGWFTTISEAAAHARAEDKPIFVDFWASWCKNCLTMDRTTFRDEAVREKLEAFVKMKVRTEDFNATETQEVLSAFEEAGVSVQGLPTYAILRPVVSR